MIRISEASIKASSLGQEFILLLDSQDLESIIQHFGSEGEGYNIPEITGALVSVGDGDYNDIFLTWERKPYLVDAHYYRAEAAI